MIRCDSTTRSITVIRVSRRADEVHRPVYLQSIVVGAVGVICTKRECVLDITRLTGALILNFEDVADVLLSAVVKRRFSVTEGGEWIRHRVVAAINFVSDRQCFVVVGARRVKGVDGSITSTFAVGMYHIREGITEWEFARICVLSLATRLHAYM